MPGIIPAGAWARPARAPSSSGSEAAEIVVDVHRLELDQQAVVRRVPDDDPAAAALIEALHRDVVGSGR